MSEKPLSGRRVAPRQARALASVDAILEAAAQVLETSGETGFNTNAIAERAGVSIGALYRYFPDKRAILVAMAERERARVDAGIAAGPAAGTVARDRAAIRAFLGAFEGRQVARRAAVQALLSVTTPEDLAEGFAAMPTPKDAQGRILTPIQAFVLSRAVHGAMRAAVLEDAPFLTSREFEDELVRLGRAYLGFSTRQDDGGAG